MNTPSLSYWHSTLQGKSLPIHENDPQEGWYRTRPRKGYRSLPVRIWRDEGSGDLLALRDGKPIDPFEVWTWVCLNPVSVEAYEVVLGGGHWPDEVPSVSLVRSYDRKRSHERRAPLDRSASSGLALRPQGSREARCGVAFELKGSNQTNYSNDMNSQSEMQSNAALSQLAVGDGTCDLRQVDPSRSYGSDSASFYLGSSYPLHQAHESSLYPIKKQSLLRGCIQSAAQGHDTLSCNIASVDPSHDTMVSGTSVSHVTMSCDAVKDAQAHVKSADRTYGISSCPINQTPAVSKDLQIKATPHDTLSCDPSTSAERMKSDTSVPTSTTITRSAAITAKVASGSLCETAEPLGPTSLSMGQTLSQGVTALRTEVLAWLSEVGEIADQVTADRCANYADAFASFEKQAEELRTKAKKPILDQGRAIDQRWKPIVSAAEDAKRQCKKALEPFLIAETERLERELMEQLQAENGDLSVLSSLSIPAKAGTFGRTISLRRVRKIVVSDRTALITHYHRDPRFLNDEAVQKLLAKLAEHDLQAGLSVPGAESVEEKVAA